MEEGVTGLLQSVPPYVSRDYVCGLFDEYLHSLRRAVSHVLADDVDALL